MDSAAESGLVCDLIIPLGWFHQDVKESSPLSRHQENLNRLQIIFGMDDHYSRDFHEEESGLAAEIQRLDFKINIVLGLVAQIVAARSELPGFVALSLGAGGVTFEAEENSLSPGIMLTFELFLDTRYPLPLILGGRIEAVESRPDHPAVIRVAFETFSEEFKELLEKYIFRCHRRHIAKLKKSNI